MTSIREFVDDLMNSKQFTVAEAMDRHLAAGFRQRTNGTWENRDEVADRFVRLRQDFERATVTVLDEFLDGARYAERHIVELRKCDGGRLALEVYVFAQTDADGRFVRIEEANFPG